MLEPSTGYSNATYENIILMVIGDFNVEPNEANMSDFLNIYNFKNLVKQKTRYKNPEKLCIDLIQTNCQRSFQKMRI